MQRKKPKASDIIVNAVDFVSIPLGVGVTIDVRKLLTGLRQIWTGEETPPAGAAELGPLEKLEIATTHIREALQAVDELKNAYKDEQNRLQLVAAEAAQKRIELDEILKDHYVASKMRHEDQSALRTALGIADIENAIRRSKVSGFITGVLASLLASLLFVGVPWAYTRFHKRGSVETPIQVPQQSPSRAK